MKKIILWSVATILISGIATAMIWWSLRPQIITLSNGTKLTLVGVTYGRHHVAPKIKLAGGRARSGGARIDSTNDAVVIWIKAEHKPDQWPNYSLLVYDQANTACVSTWARNQSQIKNGVEMQGFMLDAYPRWDRKIILRVTSYGPRGQQTAKGEFVVANPTRKSFSAWTAEPLPDKQSDDDLDVTLTRLVYGVQGFNGGNGQTKDDPMSKAVLAAFQTEQKGVTVTNWQPVRIETSDAAGNHIGNNSWSNRRENNEAVMTYQWGLWPDKSPWKLRVEMSRTSGFKDDELWKVQNVPVKTGSQQDLWNYGGYNRRATNSAFAETTLNGIHLKVFPVIQTTDQNFDNGQKSGGVRVVAEPDLPEGFRLAITATDEQGREIQNWGPNGGGGNYVVQFQNLRNARSLNLALALHQSRFVEFTVKPEKAPAATAAP